jgi:flagellum-specific peptidoglycan hydrolase FlgJ
MDIRAYCLKKMHNTQEHSDKYWQVTDENFRVYMQGIHDACEDFLGWMEGRIDQDE